MRGLQRLATRAAMYSVDRMCALPPQTARLPRSLPLSQFRGATPTRAAISFLLSIPNSGRPLRRVTARMGPTPGTLVRIAALACSPGSESPRPRMTPICHAHLLYRGNARYKNDRRPPRTGYLTHHPRPARIPSRTPSSLHTGVIALRMTGRRGAQDDARRAMNVA